MNAVPLPKSVRILGSRTKVRESRELISHGDHLCLGRCDMDKHTIEVVIGQSDDVTEQQTMLHEIMHAIIQEAGLGFMYEGEQQEHIVATLSVHLLAVMKENRRVMQYLLGRYWL